MSQHTVTLLLWERRFVAYLQAHASEHEDGSHDLSHFQRVWRTAQTIMAGEDDRVDALVVLAACYFHDIVVLPKNHPERSQASQLAAVKAHGCLTDLQFPADRLSAVCHAIESHSFSAQIVPQTIEAKVVQDADRMEALGAIGLARVFYTSGLMKQRMFDPHDPLAQHRSLDDRRFALDHFERKLLTLPQTMQTPTGRAMAQRNAEYLRQFRAKLLRELNGDYS